jgi:hypothetical protein
MYLIIYITLEQLVIINNILYNIISKDYNFNIIFEKIDFVLNFILKPIKNMKIITKIK